MDLRCLPELCLQEAYQGCMAMGQGAASAAKIMIDDDVSNRNVDITKLQAFKKAR